MNEKEKFLTKTELKKRGWSDELAGRLLPEPYTRCIRNGRPLQSAQKKRR